MKITTLFTLASLLVAPWLAAEEDFSFTREEFDYPEEEVAYEGRRGVVRGTVRRAGNVAQGATNFAGGIAGRFLP